MKKIILSIGFLIATAGFSRIEASGIHVNINIGVQPAWGPVGYDYVSYYYFPDINVYYNVNHELFYFPYRGRWMSARYLPSAYRSYDLYGLYKVVIVDNDPWRFNNRHINDYRHFRGNRSQVVIRNSYDTRYRDSRRNEVRWYDDNRRNDRGRNRVSNYGRDDRGGNYERSTDRRSTDRDTYQNQNTADRSPSNSTRGYSSSDNRRSERSTVGSNRESRSSERSERSNERSSASRRR